MILLSCLYIISCSLCDMPLRITSHFFRQNYKNNVEQTNVIHKITHTMQKVLLLIELFLSNDLAVSTFYCIFVPAIIRIKEQKHEDKVFFPAGHGFHSDDGQCSREQVVSGFEAQRIWYDSVTCPRKDY